MTVKHATASTFVFRETSAGWRMAMITHPRLGWVMIPGGHVEPDETPAEAALREVAEETGLAGVRLIRPPAPVLPAGFPHERVEPPWWVTEIPVPADNHLAGPHVHIDHQYLAVAPDGKPTTVPAHPVGWHGEDDLAAMPVPEDTKLLAKVLFAVIGDLAAGRADVAAELMRFAP
jgi:8-oxo-dGTP pyrophosphatase MutT (NUDIX family)